MSKITIDDNCKRVTWRLDANTHRKLTALAKGSALNLEEVANLVMATANWDEVKRHVAQYQRDKRQQESARKRASETLASVPPAVMERLANLSAEDIEKLLNT